MTIRSGLRSGLGAARRELLCSFDRRSVALENRGPIVSFTFDDFPRSAASAGAAVLECFGVRGTYYAAMGLMNTANELGEQFRSEDLASLLGKGHELASHTFSHLSCRSVPLSAFRSDAEKGRKAIESACGENSGNFAYPFGHVSLRAKRTLGPLFASSRSVISGLNGSEIDLNLLRANCLYGDLSASRGVEDLITQNLKQATWLIFYTHDVRPAPSPYGCTPALLEFAVSAALRSGSRILTVQEAVTEFETGVANLEEAEASALTVAG
jgi:peptidoglycan/xylan/chitin deacetylase (PgdA/CDA1 family)